LKIVVITLVPKFCKKQDSRCYDPPKRIVLQGLQQIIPYIVFIDTILTCGADQLALTWSNSIRIVIDEGASVQTLNLKKHSSWDWNPQDPVFAR